MRPLVLSRAREGNEHKERVEIALRTRRDNTAKLAPRRQRVVNLHLGVPRKAFILEIDVALRLFKVRPVLQAGLIPVCAGHYRRTMI
jgi:hypothetical protein